MAKNEVDCEVKEAFDDVSNDRRAARPNLADAGPKARPRLGAPLTSDLSIKSGTWWNADITP